MGKARDLARLSPNSSGQLPDANLLALAANKLSGVIPDANAPSGSIIQVVQGLTTVQSESSAGVGVDVDIGLGVTITPSSTSNKILLSLGSLSVVTRDNNTIAKLYLERSIGGGSYSKITGIQNYIGQGGIAEVQPTLMYLDSPNTTSSVTYRVIGQRYAGGANIAYVHNNSDSVPLKSTIVAMEVTP